MGGAAEAATAEASFAKRVASFATVDRNFAKRAEGFATVDYFGVSLMTVPVPKFTQ